jgi:type VI secretion system secreted protein Hcp
MAVDMFLKLGDIEGESVDLKHPKEFKLLSYKFGAKQSATTQRGGGGGSGAVEVRDLVITKYIDRATPALFLYCCQGTEIPDATLVVRKAGGSEALEYLKVHLAKIIIADVDNGGLATSNDEIVETVKINFSKICVKYDMQAESGGTGTGEVIKAYNIAENCEWADHP